MPNQNTIPYAITNSASVRTIDALGTGEVASAVRRMPCTIHGWRPLSVTTQPEMTATNPIHQLCAITRRYQRVSNKVPRHHKYAPYIAAAIMKEPTASMMRKAQNTTLTGGPSDACPLI